MEIKTIEGTTVSIQRADLNNAGNTNGRDVYCRRCKEPFENIFVVEDFSEDQLEKYVVLAEQKDDEGSGEYTRICYLDGCECCDRD